MDYQSPVFHSLPRKSQIVNRKFGFYREAPRQGSGISSPDAGPPPQDLLVINLAFGHTVRMKGLTKQEQLVLCVVLGLLLTGWAVKTWRNAHPVPAAIHLAKP
jgi:hypothetical protein